MEIQVQLSELIRDTQLEWLRQVAVNCLKAEREELSDSTRHANLADKGENNGKISE